MSGFIACNKWTLPCQLMLPAFYFPIGFSAEFEASLGSVQFARLMLDFRAKVPRKPQLVGILLPLVTLRARFAGVA